MLPHSLSKKDPGQEELEVSIAIMRRFEDYSLAIQPYVTLQSLRRNNRKRWEAIMENERRIVHMDTLIPADTLHTLTQMIGTEIPRMLFEFGVKSGVIAASCDDPSDIEGFRVDLGNEIQKEFTRMIVARAEFQKYANDPSMLELIESRVTLTLSSVRSVMLPSSLRND